MNFRYVAEDGKLKVLNFVLHSLEYADAVLLSGERVDGSSLFSYIEAGSSDLYVVPRYSTAFLNPFRSARRLIFSAHFIPVKVNRWRPHRSIYYAKPTDFLPSVPAISSRRWANWNIMFRVKERDVHC